MIGISRAYLAQIEGGERTGTLEVMARVARALDRRLEDLIAPGPDNFAQAAASLGAMPAKLKEIVAAIAEARVAVEAGGRRLFAGRACLPSARHRRRRLSPAPGAHADGAAPHPARPRRRCARQGARDTRAQDLATALAAFTTTRLAIVARLAKLSPEERRRTGLMAGTTEITVEGLVDDHDGARFRAPGPAQRPGARGRLIARHKVVGRLIKLCLRRKNFSSRAMTH